MVGYHADGLILNCINKDEEFENMLNHLGIPYVILGYKAFKNSHTVGVDEYEATRKGVEYILEKGIRSWSLSSLPCMMRMEFRISAMSIAEGALWMRQVKAAAVIRLYMAGII